MTKRPSFQLDTNLLSLRALIAVVDDGSFSAAAKRVGRSQSAVSLQISKLEEHIQVRLLDRTSRSVKQTPAGETFITYARRIIELADEGLAAVTTPDVSEPLRIGFAEYLVPQHLHLLLSKFKGVYPKAGIELCLGLGFDLLHDLTEHKLDVVVAGPERKDGLLLLKEPLVWTGPKGKKINSNKDFVSLILMPPPCSYRQAAFDALTTEDTAWQVSITANSVQAVQSAVAAGLGISVMAKSAVNSDLKILDKQFPKLPATSINAYWNKGDPHPLTERFLSFLKAELMSLKVE
jgi:DNA-binding transcriptional LysR family regulator